MNYYVIGNGESRKNIDLSSLEGFKIGCNGVYLHEDVDMISAMDVFWANKITTETSHELLTRDHNISNPPYLIYYPEFVATSLETKTVDKGYASGPSALDYICTEKATEDDVIYILGFDIFYKMSTVNHIYKGTQFHPPTTNSFVNTDNFKQQVKEILIRNYDKNFVWVGKCDWVMPMMKVVQEL